MIINHILVYLVNHVKGYSPIIRLSEQLNLNKIPYETTARNSNKNNAGPMHLSAKRELVHFELRLNPEDVLLWLLKLMDLFQKKEEESAESRCPTG